METQPIIEDLEELADEITKSDFPFAKVKKVAKLDPAISIVTPEAIKMLTKAAELYMLELGKASYTQAIIERRKTVQKKDVDYVIKHNALFEQLDDFLDDWPEIPTKFRVKDKTAVDDSENKARHLPESEDLNETEDQEEEVEEELQEMTVTEEDNELL